MQARTEIELLTLLSTNDKEDQNNIGERPYVNHANFVILAYSIILFLRIDSPAFDTLYVQKSPMPSLRNVVIEPLRTS